MRGQIPPPTEAALGHGMAHDLSIIALVGMLFLGFGILLWVFPSAGRAARMPSSIYYFVAGFGLLALSAILSIRG
jgi:hypothetical protein